MLHALTVGLPPLQPRPKIVITFELTRPLMWARSKVSQSASFVSKKKAMFSASHDEVATTACLRDLQLAAPFENMSAYLLIYFRVSRQLPQSESDYPTGSRL
eukprot:IDg14301t1